MQQSDKSILLDQKAKKDFCSLYIVRHGQTDWNAMERIQGSIDTQLNEIGKKQAMALGEKLKVLSFDAIYSSTLTRAYQTAEIIASFQLCSVKTDFRLNEASYGCAEGIARSEFQKKFQNEILQHERLPAQERWVSKIVADGESHAEIAERVIPCLKKISTAHLGSKVIVVSHGFVMRTLLVALGNFDDRYITVNNAGMILLDGTKSSLQLIKYDGVDMHDTKNKREKR
jgi:2,3-bisphosphoglycerate-dependent phosphoglycerate mutase